MENLTDLANAGLAGVAIAAIAALSIIVIRVLKVVGNHMNHNTASNTELASAIRESIIANKEIVTEMKAIARERSK